LSTANTRPGRIDPFRIEIFGEPASKANSRRLVSIRGKPAFIKSEKAAKYSDDFRRQFPILDPLFIGDLHIDIDIYYGSRRPDLDESLILDLMQDRAYLNDRQVKSRRARWGVDLWRPRTIISIRHCQPSDYAGAA
jgi:hypothetical protein